MPTAVLPHTTRALVLPVPAGPAPLPPTGRITAVELPSQQSASYRASAETSPPLVLTIRGRVRRPMLAWALASLWIVVTAVATFLPEHWGWFEAGLFALLALVGLILAYASLGATYNRATLTVHGGALDLRVRPLPWTRNRTFTDVVEVDAVQRREEIGKGHALSVTHSLRVRQRDQSTREILESFALSAAEITTVAQCVRERLPQSVEPTRVEIGEPHAEPADMHEAEGAMRHTSSH